MESLSPYDRDALASVAEAGDRGAKLLDGFQAGVLTLAGYITRASRGDGRYEATTTGRTYLRQTDAIEGRR
jgi:hypothetical protein